MATEMLQIEMLELADSACEAWLKKLCDELGTKEQSLVETAVVIHGLRALSELTGRHGRKRVLRECEEACKHLAGKLRALLLEEQHGDG